LKNETLDEGQAKLEHAAKVKHSKETALKDKKRAAAAKVTTSKDLKQFKNLIEDNLTQQNSAPSGQVKDTIPSDVIQGFTYGRKVRPSTPIQEVISYRFAEKSEQELNRFYSDFRDVQEASKTQVRKIPLTVASRGHASAHKKAMMMGLDQGKELFKIGKFKRVGPRVVTKHSHTRPGDEVFEDLESLDQVVTAESDLVTGSRPGPEEVTDFMTKGERD